MVPRCTPSVTATQGMISQSPRRVELEWGVERPLCVRGRPDVGRGTGVLSGLGEFDTTSVTRRLGLYPGTRIAIIAHL